MAVDPSPSHRERKKQATRLSIHRAAFDLAEEYGLANTTVEAISERAGVAPRTFWAYFSAKEEAVLDHDPELPGRLQAALLARPAGEDPITALRQILVPFLTARVSDSDFALRRQRLIRGEPHLRAAVAASFDEIEEALVAALTERSADGAAGALRAAALVVAAFGACRIAHHRWADSGGTQPLPDLIDQALTEMAVGLAPLAFERSSH